VGKFSQVEGPASVPRSKEIEAGQVSGLESFKKPKSQARRGKKVNKIGV
jgi:hypothetical protein